MTRTHDRLFGAATGGTMIFGMVGDFFGLCYLFAFFGCLFGLWIAQTNIKKEKNLTTELSVV